MMLISWILIWFGEDIVITTSQHKLKTTNSQLPLIPVPVGQPPGHRYFTLESKVDQSVVFNILKEAISKWCISTRWKSPVANYFAKLRDQASSGLIQLVSTALSKRIPVVSHAHTNGHQCRWQGQSIWIIYHLPQVELKMEEKLDVVTYRYFRQ